MDRPNLHATGIVLGTVGLLIAGPSGAGKTTLALAMIETWRRHGRFARLIADDQVFLSAANGRLLASAPPSIAGTAEIFGLGPMPAEYLGTAAVDAFCRLGATSEPPRFRQPAFEMLQGCRVPRIELAARNVQAAAPALSAWIGALQAP